jgi:hypothetical protein
LSIHEALSHLLAMSGRPSPLASSPGGGRVDL